MKTVCKKLLCLMLVAMMLVSAIPAAFAAGEVCPYEGCGSANVTAKQVGSYKAATCQDEGTDVFFCNTCEKYFSKPSAKLPHDLEENVTKAATCTEAGEKTVSCKNDGCDYEETVTIPAGNGHSFDAGVVTTPSTCTVAGVKTFTCQNDGCNFTKTEAAPLASHNYGSDGKCTACSATDGIVRYNVTFRDDVAGKAELITFVEGTTITNGMLPDGSLKDGKKFIGWYNGSSKLEDLLQNGKWHAGMPNVFEAKYIDSNDDGVSKLYVYVRFYVKGVQQGYTQLLLDPVTFKDGENMFNWLQNNKGTIGAAIEAKDTEDKYDWYPEYFYDYSGEEILTAQNMKANGDQSVVVKAFSKDATEAKVLLYVHTSKTSTPAAIYEMNGYTAGNTVTLAAVKTELKNKYTVSAGLYDADDWDDLLNGLSPMASNGIAVQHNGTTEIHVLAKAASSNADSTNPKTGDYITIAATTMVLAAGAFVAMVEMKKRKMI